MVIPTQYAYLVSTILFLVFWFILFYLRKDLRKEMLFMSIGVALAALFAEYFWWTADWWRPITVTGTRIGIEDFLLGFTNGGIAAVIFEEIFKKRFYRRKNLQHGLIAFCVILLNFLIMAGSFWLLHLSSFWATTIGLFTTGSLIVFFRKDLWLDAVMSGVLIAVLFLPFYWIFMFLSPGIIEKFWMFNHLTGITITGVPLEDIVFYFLVGFSVGPFYAYWQGERLRKMPK